ncbi:MAG: hypothetical protein GAK31_01705 [Stenotrophomonas maltophilia]|uniref:Uncharacterized protein n=1 Tax=Stenotrophomonas maltophilia TaxID=40324 RepID=A0A7V8FI87_STEMA|nr:MAG: hypothetical protein GAK31_01705 [Stenotrophomonas maltophilia]
MKARPNSPNGMWERLSFTIERDHRGARTIRRPNGSVVDTTRMDGEDGHAAELRVASTELAKQVAA